MPTIARDFTYTYEGQTLTYTVIDETAKTCETKAGDSKKRAGNNVSGHLIIPEDASDGISNYKVLNIGRCSFAGCDLESVNINNSISSIGDYAFYDCYNLTSISIPSSVISIGSEAFEDCSHLVKAEYASIEHLCGIQFGNSTANPLYYAKHLYINGNEITKIVIPSTVTAVGNCVFVNCEYLTDVQISSTVSNIGCEAFFQCKGITSINIPSSVVAIGQYAFYGCTRLSSLILSNSITSIDECTFYGCSSLTAVDIPSSVMSIGKYAFYNCFRLNSLNISNGVTYIDDFAFSNCSALESVVIPQSVESIGEKAFYNYSAGGVVDITSLSLTPPRCKNGLPFYYSKGCTLYVPDVAVDAYKVADYWKVIENVVGIKSFQAITISGLHYIINLFQHTATVSYAEQNSLSNYEGMQSVVIPETVEYEGESYTVTGIGEEAFNNCWGIKSVTLPSTLQSIGKLAFGYCTSLRSVVIPDEVTVIDDEAFTGCSALASVTIGSSVETIGDYAFFGCTGLSSINVPESVKNIGENAFMGVHWINEVHAESDVPAEAPVSAFSTNAYRNATLVVPDGALSTYKSHPTWSNFLAIREEGNSTTDIMVVEGAIIVRGADSVRIYNPSGVQIYSGKSGRIELPSGIYLVVTDAVSRKVRL